MKISIITTTYNRNEFLADTINSVQANILTPFSDVEWEHIIYDDGSTDGTQNVFKEHQWQNVKYIQSNVNKGQSAAKNAAIQACTGDWIIILDSDDIFLQRTLFHFVQAHKDYPNKNWFVSEALRVDNELRYKKGEDIYNWNYEGDYKTILEMIFRGEHFIQSNTFFSKKLFEQAGKFAENLNIAEDLDLYIRFLLLEEMPQYLSNVSHLNRKHAKNVSKGVDLEIHKQQVKDLYQKYSKQLNSLNIKCL